MSAATCPPALEDVTRPGWPVPADGWDCHAHVFGPVAQFPYSDRRRYTPPEQTAADYLRVLDRLGLRCGVLVQPSVYGTDNAALVDACIRSQGRLVGVVELDALQTADADLARLSGAGVRGVRIWWDGTRPDDWLPMVARRLRPFGWHLDIYPVGSDALRSLARIMDRVEAPVMIEAMGSPRHGEGVASPGFQALLALLKEGAAMVKLSHPYQIHRDGPPYAGCAPFARAIVEAASDRAVWGSDWPHPMVVGPMPDDGALLDLLPTWSGSIATAQAILSDNAARFYGGSGARPAAVALHQQNGDH